jgi:hypothetical protein
MKCDIEQNILIFPYLHEWLHLILELQTRKLVSHQVLAPSFRIHNKTWQITAVILRFRDLVLLFLF